ncbi:MAG: Hsp70 family protein [Ruminococcus flavefaciens]|nr:Hsp70 family protein [Ruminococcus flavefaciens]MCM1228575.1 Hsp70 family protein [Ruminococcus flavefaciens]
MSNIGFDFGTTNSIISYHDNESDTLTCFRTTAGSTEYVPTVIAFDNRRGVEKISIGAGAKLMGEGSPNVYGRFKLRLGTLFDDVIPDKDKPRTAHEVAVKYISHLLDDFRNSNHTIDNMVMTIPQVWYNEQSNYTARENIKSILLEVGFSPEQFRFQSEPVAAAAYFCWQWQKSGNAPYDGTVFVIDFGGGTLDATLCKVENGTKIRTLENFDSVSDGAGFEYGHAGSAFLSEVIYILCSENNVSADEEERSLARNELELLLINRAGDVTDIMSEYLISPEDTADDEQLLFSLTRLGRCDVRCEHLLRAFNKVNNEYLEKAVSQIMSSDSFDSKNVKVILVGGFSNFCCVENKVRAMFGSRPDANDPRFPKFFTNENRALSIAKGAALIADGRITVDPVFPYELGLIAGIPDPENPMFIHDEYIPLIKKNTLADEYREPIYKSGKISVYPDDSLYIRMYQTTGGEKRIFGIYNKDLQNIFPPSDSKKVYEMGLSLDEHMIPILHARSEDGSVNSSSLNKILERIAIIKVQEK